VTAGTMSFGRSDPRATYADGFAAAKVHRLDLYDLFVGGLLVLFLTIFFLSATLQQYGLPNRMEDVVFVLLVPFGYRYLPARKNVLFWLIVAYFSLSAFPYLAGVLANDYQMGIYPAVIIAKEVEYFYIAFLICQNRTWWVLGTIDALAMATVLNGVRLMVTGAVDYYGIGTLATYQSPSMAGALYLFTAVWLHIRLRLLPWRIARLAGLGVVAVAAVCVVATVSRSSIGAMLLYAVVYMVLSLNVIGIVGLVAAFKAAPPLIAAVALATGAVGIGEIALRLVMRWSSGNLSTSGADRAGKWEYYLDMLELPEWIIGKGKAFPNALDATFGMGVDSQYVRTLLEQGVLGVVLLAAIVIVMLVHIHGMRGEWRHACAVIAAMLLMSIPLEAFQVSKSGGFFWLIMFYLYFCQRRIVATAPLPMQTPPRMPLSPVTAQAG
jgi:hypothetical protein